MKKIFTQREPIEIGLILAENSMPHDGSDVVFIGKVRNNSRSKEVLFIDYEIYDSMAIKEMSKIADEAIEKWNLSRVIIIHRYGRVNIGEASIVIITSSPHREESYSGSRYIIDEIKKRVPIWKKEYYTDGSEWIGDRN
ncbi:MAG TPA: molybdenum cofactor biosynthesis protein MoaE [Spirochaetota bacterium]|nr:molybdenum cofactor biosynthesis protein MoaE [Spirochaetota bacterium]HOV08521.1 molybdenum cofactor biosynthesis protein MoaE [Spirochaetota bacterium]HPX90374.1 molybdenum cofactor biosynthesis protein MoaE [Spirochaetota bacterium]